MRTEEGVRVERCRECELRPAGASSAAVASSAALRSHRSFVSAALRAAAASRTWTQQLAVRERGRRREIAEIARDRTASLASSEWVRMCPGTASSRAARWSTGVCLPPPACREANEQRW